MGLLPAELLANLKHTIRCAENCDCRSIAKELDVSRSPPLRDNHFANYASETSEPSIARFSDQRELPALPCAKKSETRY